MIFAATPTSFAVTWCDGRDSTFAHGHCFGLGAGRGSSFFSLGNCLVR